MKHRHRLPPPPDSLMPLLRWLNISLRSLHLIGLAGMGGGFLFALPEAQWLSYGYLSLISGGLLASLYLWTDEDWLWQLKGQVIVLKVLLLALTRVAPLWRAEVMLLVIVLSAFFAHAPARIRGWAWGRDVPLCGTSSLAASTEKGKE